jgi:hypothetical protein
MDEMKDKKTLLLHQKFNDRKACLTMSLPWHSYEPAYENEGQRGRDSLTVSANKNIYLNNPLVQVTHNSTHDHISNFNMVMSWLKL